jgi:hypothetical protein
MTFCFLRGSHKHVFEEPGLPLLHGFLYEIGILISNPDIMSNDKGRLMKIGGYFLSGNGPKELRR